MKSKSNEDDKFFSRSNLFNTCDSSKMNLLINQLQFNYCLLIDRIMDDDLKEEGDDDCISIVEIDEDTINIMVEVNKSIEILRDASIVYCNHNYSSTIESVGQVKK